MKKLMVVVMLLTLGACSDPSMPRITEDLDGVTQYFVVPTPLGKIPCISWSAGYGGGLSCDWSGR